MSEKRKKTASILLECRAKSRCIYELFPASEWPNKVPFPSGLFRVRKRKYDKFSVGRWLCPEGKYTFFNLAGLLQLFGGDVPAFLGLEEPDPPEIEKGDVVRYPTGNVLDVAEDGQPPQIVPATGISRAKGPAKLKTDGRWYIDLYDYELGQITVAVDQIEILRR